MAKDGVGAWFRGGCSRDGAAVNIRVRWGGGGGWAGWAGCLKALRFGESADTVPASYRLLPTDAKQPLVRAVGMGAPVRTAPGGRRRNGEPAALRAGGLTGATCRLKGPGKNVGCVHRILDHGGWERAASDAQRVPFDRTRNGLEWSRHGGA